jgi:hypothetical protein
LDSYSITNATVLHGDDQRSLYTIRVKHEHNGARIKDVIVHKYKHQFSAKELLLQYWAKQEDAIIWRSDPSMRKACAINGTTYATDSMVKSSGELDENDLNLLEEIVVPSDFEV